MVSSISPEISQKSKVFLYIPLAAISSFTNIDEPVTLLLYDLKVKMLVSF